MAVITFVPTRVIGDGSGGEGKASCCIVLSLAFCSAACCPALASTHTSSSPPPTTVTTDNAAQGGRARSSAVSMNATAILFRRFHRRGSGPPPPPMWPTGQSAVPSDQRVRVFYHTIPNAPASRIFSLMLNESRESFDFVFKRDLF